MRFIWRFPKRGDVLGVLFIAGLLCLLAVFYIRFPGFKAATGFGPDWDCTSVPKGEPVCMKKVAR